ncbi:MAG: hypothetical protein B9J98_05085 [Candidatus Terraquivivens tikiterensis]|uniref:Mandelate racemase/muconate lactonizing enzyme C-terminal domain-containing protein n=1 Tax=Candidatus Terraquivivens tikiterensis TaxID=1980982 RepID=A0A2R7Y2X2_9ARCH|nr:MAG: hypothetical protein B9J98_05085 [Candidatus Terraquivivens tikiterensis]
MGDQDADGGIGFEDNRRKARSALLALKEPMRLSVGMLERRPFALIEVHTDDGTVGLGETFVNFPPWSLEERKVTVDNVKKLLLGEDPTDVEALWKKMYVSLVKMGLQGGCKGAIIQTISGIDIALWDLLGKVKNQPVCKLISNNPKRRLRLYATGLSGRDPAGHARRLVSEGYDTLKLRIGFDPEKDVELVKSVREAVGKDVKLIADANMAWDYERALEMARRLERYELFWLEEPILCDDLDGMSRLAAELDTWIGAGENAYSLDEFERVVKKRAADVLMPDVSKAGGITECVKIAGLINSSGLPFSPHFYGSEVGFAATLHFVAATEGSQQF